jgi:hypothetical protein
METSPLTSRALDFAAGHFGVAADLLTVRTVSGGYSRNRRALIGRENEWIFIKEVDVDLLPGEGEEELGWLAKDFMVTDWLRSKGVDVVADWAELSDDGHSLMMRAARVEDGWHWTPPLNRADQIHDYIQAVIRTVRLLESVMVDGVAIEKLKLHPFFRDKIASDDGLEQVIENEAMREDLRAKFTDILADTPPPYLDEACQQTIELLGNQSELARLQKSAEALRLQPQNLFNHCDVRSDNLAWNEKTGRIMLVDWNWASLAPKNFGTTEFLVDMARRGADVTPWLGDVNPELVAATIGFWLKRCLKPPLKPGDTLRQMQAESAAVSWMLYTDILR